MNRGLALKWLKIRIQTIKLIRMVNMRIKTISFLMLALFLVLSSRLVAQSDIDYCPVEPGDQTVRALPSEETPPPSKAYTVPRKQLLLEAATGLW
jgi:hypothetical protein